MQWPAQSPDLNIIENVWAYVKGELFKQKGDYEEEDMFYKAEEIFFSKECS